MGRIPRRAAVLWSQRPIMAMQIHVLFHRDFRLALQSETYLTSESAAAGRGEST